MKHLSLFIAALLGAGSAAAQTLDCAALANSAGAEPAGYAEQCMPGRTTNPSSSGVLAPTDTAFTIDVRGQAGVAARLANSLYSFTLNAFATQSLRGVTNPQVFAMDFDVAGTTLFGITGAAAAPNPGTLGTINTTTGAFTVIAAVTGLTAGDGVSGLAIHPRTGVAYIAAVGGTPAASRLYTLNLTTGAATLVGTITAPTDATGTIMIDISMNCDGALYAHNIADDALYSVNVATGAGTFIGGHGLAANFAQGMDFDNQSGTLYAFIYTGTGTNRFGTFNLATGAFTTLVQDNPLGEYEGAVPTQCPALTPPSLTLAKRVVAAPSVPANVQASCDVAGTTAVLPFSGGSVYYCYRATNTSTAGTPALQTHTVTDTAFAAPIVSNLQLTLPVGATSTWVASPLLNVTGNTSSAATWTACTQAGTCVGTPANTTATATVPAGAVQVALTQLQAPSLQTIGLLMLLIGIGGISLVSLRRNG